MINVDLNYYRICIDILLRNSIFFIATFSENTILPSLMYLNLSVQFFNHGMAIYRVHLHADDTINN